MNKLPNVDAFPIEKELHNVQTRFYGSANDRVPRKEVNVLSKINAIFSSPTHIYKSRVKIFTSNDVLERTIIGKNNTYLLTLSGDKININEIIDIEKL